METKERENEMVVSIVVTWIFDKVLVSLDNNTDFPIYLCNILNRFQANMGERSNINNWTPYAAPALPIGRVGYCLGPHFIVGSFLK